MIHPESVRLIEVGPRDGLQNEPKRLSVAHRVDLIRRLAACGLRVIEAGSFVSPKWVPQMAETAEILGHLDYAQIAFPVLVPNRRGLDDAMQAGAREIAVFTAASETFSQRNTNCSMAEGLARYGEICAIALANDIAVRGYISCVVGCPYEGAVSPRVVAETAAALDAMGCYEISLGDTIGIGTPSDVRHMLEAVLDHLPASRLAGHFHDTYGQAIANIWAALDMGVTAFDASVGGLGGCPYAKGAGGNVATEDVVYSLEQAGIATGVDLQSLVDTAWFICRELGRDPDSRLARVLKNRGEKAAETIAAPAAVAGT